MALIRPGQTPLIDLLDPPDWTRPEWFHDCPNEPHIDTPLHRGRLLLASQFVHDVVDTDETVNSVSDLGAGDGGLLETLGDLVRELEFYCWGFDLAKPSVDYARTVRGVDVRWQNCLAENIEYGDVSVATEFLEHMVDPHGAVQHIAARSRYLVASSPHTETAEDHYPLHTWAFSLDGYRALLQDNGFDVVRQETTGMFQCVLGVRRD